MSQIFRILLILLVINLEINATGRLNLPLSQKEGKLVSISKFFKSLFDGTIFNKMATNDQSNNHESVRLSANKSGSQFQDPTRVENVRVLAQTVKQSKVSKNASKNLAQLDKQSDKNLHQQKKRIIVPKKIALSDSDGLVEMVVENHRKKLTLNQQKSTNLAQTVDSGKIGSPKFLASIKTKNVLANGKMIIAKDGKVVRDPTHLKNYSNTQYVVKMSVGKKSKKYKFILDTGSTTLLLITSKCTREGCKEHKSYTQSRDAEKLSAAFLANDNQDEVVSAFNTHTINYAEGFVDYETLVDNFWIGDFEVLGQSFGGVVDEKNVFDNAIYDGLVGLAYAGQGVPPGITPIFDNIIKQKGLERNIFALYISRVGFASSRFWLGGVNLQYLHNADMHNVTWHRVIRKKWWTLKLDKVLINGQDSKLCDDGQSESYRKNCAIIMDSGTSSMAAPAQTHNKFMNLLNKIGKSNSIKSWPKLTFVIDGKNYDMPNYAYLSTNTQLTYQKSCKKSDFVEPEFVPFDSGDDEYAIWIAGDAFLSEYISIYDRDNDMVGLGKPWLKNIEKIQKNEKLNKESS